MHDFQLDLKRHAVFYVPMSLFYDVAMMMILWMMICVVELQRAKVKWNEYFDVRSID
jgi:hypothetical protein